MKYRVALRVLGAAALLGGAVAIAAQQTKQQAEPVMADVKEMGLLATAVPVTDVSRATKFYTEGMGMIALDKGPMAAQETPLKFPAGGPLMILMQARDAAALTPRNSSNRLILAVPDLKALQARLLAAGYKLSGEIHEQAQYKTAVATITDPDGNVFELVQRMR